MTSPAFTTRIKLQLNGLLRPVGLQVGTTVASQREQARLEQLQESGHWGKAQYDQGLKFEPQRYLTFLREMCLPYKAEYSKFPVNSNGNEREFFLENGYFRSVDAEMLYSVVRHNKPRRIIEVGSGFSTRLMALAIKDGKLDTSITSIDPFPRVGVDGFVNQHIQSVVERVDRSVIFDSLEEGDLLFIDSSHQIVTGGDVPYLFLEILPRLKKGVSVHIHDIFLPFEYPEEAVLAGWEWAEQYLVHAFLAFNETFQILWPARYMWGYYQHEVLDVIPADRCVFPPSSLWIEKTT